MTYREQVAMAVSVSGDDESAAEDFIERAVNKGGQIFNGAIRNYFNRRSKTADVVEDQQYYQLPKDCLRITGVDIIDAVGRRRPLTKVPSEESWRSMNYNQNRSNWTIYYFVKGADEFGLYPVPSATITGGVTIYYEPQQGEFVDADFTDGTVTFTNGSATITHSATGFTEAMVGKIIRATSASGEYEYRIESYTSPSTMTIEEPYVGASGSKSFVIGDSFFFPTEYHEAPVDYALSRYFDKVRDPNRARYHRDLFEQAVHDAKSKYATSTSGTVVHPGSEMTQNPWGNNTITIRG